MFDRMKVFHRQVIEELTMIPLSFVGFWHISLGYLRQHKGWKSQIITLIQYSNSHHMSCWGCCVLMFCFIYPLAA